MNGAERLGEVPVFHRCYKQTEAFIIQKFINEFYNADYVFYKENMPKIVIAELGNDAGIIGSALYA